LAAVQTFSTDALGEARWRVDTTVSANNLGTGLTVTCSTAEGSSDFILYNVGDTVPSYGTLGTYDQAVTVYTHANVPFFFATALGLHETDVTRRATAVMTAVISTNIIPMWVSETTPYNYGQYRELLMADGPHYPGIPGNFGWLTPKTGTDDFYTLIKGYNVPQSILDANIMSIGETMYGEPGVKVGLWTGSLAKDDDSRLKRALWAPWVNDTFDNHRKDNPRILIIPICEYQPDSGGGANAAFVIKKFGAFWLEDVATSGKSITGRFIQYVVPGAGHGTGYGETGLWTTFLAN
jgi:hypothetical protein